MERPDRQLKMPGVGSAEPREKKQMMTQAKLRRVFADFGLTVFVFGMISFGYVTTVQFMHPGWLKLPLSHLVNIRIDTFGMVAFAAAALGFLMFRLFRTASS